MNNYKNSLITGAGSGIGAEIAIVLAKQNYHTIITGKSLFNLEKTEKNNISGSILNQNENIFKL